VWLIFSVVKRVIGFLFLGGLALGLFLLWQNPELRDSVIGTALNLANAR